MSKIDWSEQVNEHQDELIADLKQLLRIKSVLQEDERSETAPFGNGVKAALNNMLNLGERDGFNVKNVGNVAGHIEYGSGSDIIGVLCHVDVVPAGDGWESDPFVPVIRDGKIYARGAIDDKGPTIAAYYGLKIVKQLNLKLNKRVRLIIGTDEESDWRCVDHYFSVEQMPIAGFAPDANFPIINAEKGIAHFEIVKTNSGQIESKEQQIVVENFQAGERKNMVPNVASCSLTAQHFPEIVQRFKTFTEKHKLANDLFVEQGELKLQLYGKAAHAMEPREGINAGTFLAKFLTTLNIDAESKQFFQFVVEYIHDDSRGQRFGIAYSDTESGDLTINAGTISYHRQKGGRIGISLRYPVTADLSTTLDKLRSCLNEAYFEIDELTDSQPHYVQEDNKLIKTLSKVYEEQTGEDATLLATGGGTYARSLTKGVAFGALFPHRQDVAHQVDEHIYIEDLLKATAIYAQAIYELAK